VIEPPRQSKTAAGFSLLERLIVLLIIATISGYAVVTFMRTQANLARNESAAALLLHWKRHNTIPPSGEIQHLNKWRS
jgi:prepilin-type N-terminal cleavage/methylation domain-containing protein